MLNVRKWAAVVLVGGILGLAGCGGGGGTAADGEQQEAGRGPVTLTMWAHQGQPAEVEAIQQIVDAFNKAHEGEIQVQLEIIPASGFAYEDKVKASSAAGRAPDILDVDGPNVASYAYSGILRPLDEFFTEEELANFVPSIIEQGTWDGKLYALGAFNSSLVIFYNKKYFDEAGIKAPESLDEAWTADEFKEVARRLTIPGERWGMDFMMHWGPAEWSTYMASVFIWSNGGKLIADDGSRATGYLNSPEAVEAMKWFQSFFTEGLATASPGPQDFVDGKAAMMINGPWYIATLKQAEGLDWGVMPLPYFKKKVSPSGSWAWGITQQSKHPEAAAKVLKWLVGTDTGVIPMVKANDMPPATWDAYEKLPEYQELPKRIFMEQVQKTAVARPVTPAYPMLTTKFAEAVHSIALGTDPAEALTKAAQEVDRDIEAHGGYKPLDY
ncbi:MAG: sugar ABC transporter substrate-binding protein [Bacillota bacterium]